MTRSEKHYNANPAKFQAEEQADVEYVVLDMATVMEWAFHQRSRSERLTMSRMPIGTTPEERRGSHILINAPASASAADREAMQTKAE